MDKLPWEKWYHGDWLKDSSVGRCSLLARGLWIELLSLMFLDSVSEISGTPDELSRIARCSRVELEAGLEELKRTQCASVTVCNGNVTVACRRLQKQRNARENTAKRVKRHREKQPGNAPVTVQKSEVRSQKSEVR